MYTHTYTYINTRVYRIIHVILIVVKQKENHENCVKPGARTLVEDKGPSLFANGRIHNK